ncbi:fumarylacetoacetate hydrolase family protein [Oscillochloris sp. ZM17-4]|uniref:2-keto-4-pentenoate hydratase n=1 Tax=Oscillochloris sp. ZM17-4 TaxID=2866714 RepID=UPI001C72E493|nr:fumarylacetoacetate hydrolase family protein [Oscillochloris sp. ZM17-4]MBX0327112.1 fumarylacetoacetate hydrolase family protein [Oscillochloris sp. ZM17-4]
MCNLQSAICNLQSAICNLQSAIKAGATNAGAQASFGLSQSVYAALLAEGQVPDGGEIDAGRLIHPRVECEVAFRMAADLAGPGVTPEAALAAVAGAMAAFEIVDARTVGWGVKMPEMIADSVFAARYVVSADLLPVGGLDLAAVSVTLLKNGEQAAQASGANVLGSPANALAWLANRMAEHGRALHAGDIVLAGSLTPLVPAAAGDSFEARFEHLGAVRVRFV